MKCYTSAEKIVKTLQDAGFAALFCGGFVRDYLLEKKSYDIDIATNATPEQIIQMFEKTILVGINYAIVVVVIDGLQFEVATFRKDEEYIDGRRPSKISFCTAEEDAFRRDFTINGMFFDPIKKEVIDYVGGKQDLKRKVISAIGNAHMRFKEDRLRMVRACRYSARFSFAIEKKTSDAIISHANELLSCVACERIYDEFKKMTEDPHLFDALLLMHQFTLLEHIFVHYPLLSYKDLDLKLQKAKPLPKNTFPMVYIIELFSALTVDKKISLCKFFKVSNKELNFIKDLHTWMDSTILDDVSLVSLYAKDDAEKLKQTAYALNQDNLFLAFHKKKEETLQFFIERKKLNSPIISSADLRVAGVAPGIKMGIALKEAEKVSIEQNIKDKKTLLSTLKLEDYQ